jgi:hypothetical protein
MIHACLKDCTALLENSENVHVAKYEYINYNGRSSEIMVSKETEQMHFCVVHMSY